mmetsp:Transcript_74290/g.168283  ORF Transcript_74290/g.168283 Transcript_74290/m.168283 type:complete len:83 (+) Transcript_74290:3-251(+)
MLFQKLRDILTVWVRTFARDYCTSGLGSSRTCQDVISGPDGGDAADPDLPALERQNMCPEPTGVPDNMAKIVDHASMSIFST